MLQDDLSIKTVYYLVFLLEMMLGLCIGGKNDGGISFFLKILQKMMWRPSQLWRRSPGSVMTALRFPSSSPSTAEKKGTVLQDLGIKPINFTNQSMPTLS